MGCKNCSDVTVLTGEAGNGIQTVVDNGDGTFTFFFTDGSTFTTPDFNGSGGAPGAAATIAVGTVTIGPPGTAPSVTNVGTSSAAIFDFVFPIGIGYGKTLWVDDQFGSDVVGEAVRDRIDLPWKSINAAITAASADDTIHVRTGSYTEDIVLKHLVNIYLDEGVIINGEIFDNDPLTSLTDAVTASISGNGVLQDNQTSSACINIVGIGSNIKIRLREIINDGTGIIQSPLDASGVFGESTLLVETDTIRGNTTNYFVTARGKSDCTIIVNQYAETVNTGTNAFAGVDVRGQFEGKMNFKAPRVFIGNGNNANGGRAFSSELDTKADALINFEVDTLINDYDNTAPSLQFGTLNANGDGTYIFKVGNCYSKTRNGLVVGGLHLGTPSDATVVFEGTIFTRDNVAARLYSYAEFDPGTGDVTREPKLKVIFKNSSISRGVDVNANGTTTYDSTTVIQLGNSGFGTNTHGPNSNYLNLEFINTQIIKNFTHDKGISPADPGAQQNGLVSVQGKDNNIYFKGCDIVGGVLSQTVNVYAVQTFDVVNTVNSTNPIEIYFKDTESNKDLFPTYIVQKNIAATGFKFDSGLTTFNYLHSV